MFVASTEAMSDLSQVDQALTSFIGKLKLRQTNLAVSSQPQQPSPMGSATKTHPPQEQPVFVPETEAQPSLSTPPKTPAGNTFNSLLVSEVQETSFKTEQKRILHVTEAYKRSFGGHQALCAFDKSEAPADFSNCTFTLRLARTEQMACSLSVE